MAASFGSCLVSEPRLSPQLAGSTQSASAASNMDSGVLSITDAIHWGPEIKWEVDAEQSTHCFVCNSKFGDLMNRRHHCRMCGESVCHACSPNMLQLNGNVQRYCTPCVLGGAGALDLLPRLQNLREMIQRFSCSADDPSLPAITYPLPAQALADCEEAVALLASKQGFKTSVGIGSFVAEPGSGSLAPCPSFGSAGLRSLGIGPGSLVLEGMGSAGSGSMNRNSLGQPGVPLKPCLPVVQPFASWEVNTAKCSICKAALGKRRFRRRHHCRVCGRCTCSKCAPNFVALPNMPGTHRACNLCVAIVHRPVRERHGPPINWIVSRSTVTHQV